MAAANQQQVLNIPLEIVEEILIHLPVKSLSRFRCVSKSWRSIITQPGFIRKHLIHASRPENLSQKKLIIGNEGFKDHAQFSCFPLSTLQPVETLCCPILRDLGFYSLLVASCDGLLCLWIDDSVYLWNPCLNNNNAYTQVFTPEGETCFLNYIGVYFDLGYDSTVDDYKLLMLSVRSNSRRLTTETRVYSMRSESWTKLEDYPDDRYHFPVRSVFVNGSFYLIAYPVEDAARVILSFHLSDDGGKYGEVLSLPEDDHRQDVNVELCVLRGMLGVVVKYRVTGRVVVWVMKGREWDKRLDITLADDEYDVDRRMSVMPFYMDENEEVKLGLFSWSWGAWRTRIENKRSGLFLHIESLVSPVGSKAGTKKKCLEHIGGMSKRKTCTRKADEFFVLTQDKYVHNN